MTEHDRDKAEIAESVQAVRTARIGAVRTDAVAESAHRAVADIRSTVEENGYLDRFRLLLRGA